MLTLSKDRSTVKIDDKLQIKVGSTISYKPTDSEQVGIGKVVELRHPGPKQSDTDSVWAAIADIVSGQVDWIPVSLWAEQREKGMFDEEPVIIKEPAAAPPVRTSGKTKPTPQPITTETDEQPTANQSNEPGILPTGELELW